MERRLVKKNDYLWNMIGSVCYSGSSFFYLLLVTRVCGVKEAGVFSLAFATAQLLLTIGRFGVRTYQATDLKEKYSFFEYSFSRCITCLFMMVGAWIYVMIMRFDIWKASVCIWVAAFKMIDAIEDVFHGEMQRRFRVDLMGKLLALRNVFSCILFTILVIMTRDILITCIVTTMISLLVCIIVNIAGLKQIGVIGKACKGINICMLLEICFPIFLSTFLSLYLYNIPKYAIDYYMVAENQTYYSILFMPSFVITLFSEIITKPVMTTITIEWERDIKQFRKMITAIICMIAMATIVIVFGGHLIGRRLLEVIYGVDLSLYKKEFIILLIGGGISASVYILYNLLIAIRHQTCIIITYGITAVVMTFFGYWLVQYRGMKGAAFGYLFSCLILCIVFLTILGYLIGKRYKEQKQKGI